MKLTSFSRAYWEMAVACGGSKKDILRNYDIVEDRKKGKTLAQLAIKYQLSEVHICRILKKNL